MNYNEAHIDPISSWITYWLQRNVASESSREEGPFHLEAHGCYDMGYDCDTVSVFG
jgi:hypothetical protein